jgi:hypothetical protein
MMAKSERWQQGEGIWMRVQASKRVRGREASEFIADKYTFSNLLGSSLVKPYLRKAPQWTCGIICLLLLQYSSNYCCHVQDQETGSVHAASNNLPAEMERGILVSGWYVAVSTHSRLSTMAPRCGKDYISYSRGIELLLSELCGWE